MNSVGNWNSSKQMVFPEPWYALDPLWEGDEEIIEQGLPHEELAPPWQILILGDFSPTRHLKLLTGKPTKVDIIDISPIGNETDGAPEMITDVPTPRLRRQVWLCNTSRVRLGYAVSWWEASNIDQYLKNKSLPIWENLASLRTEIYREIQKVQYGHSDALEEEFGQKGPFWGRYYTLYHQKQPLTLIFEVFSPILTEYLGPCRMFTFPT